MNENVLPEVGGLKVENVCGMKMGKRENPQKSRHATTTDPQATSILELGIQLSSEVVTLSTSVRQGHSICVHVFVQRTLCRSFHLHINEVKTSSSTKCVLTPSILIQYMDFNVLLGYNV